MKPKNQMEVDFQRDSAAFHNTKTQFSVVVVLQQAGVADSEARVHGCNLSVISSGNVTSTYCDSNSTIRHYN